MMGLNLTAFVTQGLGSREFLKTMEVSIFMQVCLGTPLWTLH